MAVIGYQLTYGDRPWNYNINPWRSGKEHERLRPIFRQRYDEVTQKLIRDHRRASQSPTEGYIHLGALLVKMLRYRLGENMSKGNQQRLDINQVLEHSDWGSSFLSDHTRAKRARLVEQLDVGGHDGPPEMMSHRTCIP